MPRSAATFAELLGARACLLVLPVVDGLGAHAEELSKVVRRKSKALALHSQPLRTEACGLALVVSGTNSWRPEGLAR